MDSMNINDAARVSALLDQLKSSTVWQNTVATDPPAVPTLPYASNSNGPSAPSDAPSAQTSVATLLSQLSGSSIWASVVAGRLPSTAPPSAPPSAAPSPPADVRSLTFQQALPLLAGLAADPAFVAALKAMKAEQAALERRLHDERARVRAEHEKKLGIALTKARMVGASGLSKHEAAMMTDAFARELRAFDRDRVLPALDKLLARQQAALQGLGVPTMFVTALAEDRERQARVMQVLEGIVEGDRA